MVSPRYWSVVAVALLGCSLATPLPSPREQARGQDMAEALSSALGAKAPATSFRVDVLDASALADGADGSDNGIEEDKDEPTRQLSPTTQSFLSTLGTALGPIVGAIVGPLLTNIGQNLSAGSGAQAIQQLQQAAQAAVAAQQQQQAGQAGNPAAAVAAAAAAVEISGAGPTSTTPSSSPSTPRPRPQTARPTRRPGASARPARPGARPAVTVDATSPAPATASVAPAPPHQSFDAFVLDVPGKGPFLFLMTPNATAAEQSAAIKQAQQQAAHLLAVDGQSSPIGGVASLIGTTPRPQVTKPTSVGPLPVHPVVSVTPPPPPPPLPNPLPSYHSLLEDDEQDQQGEEEVAVETVEAPENSDEQHSTSGAGEVKDDSDFSSQSFLERLFPEMI